MPKPQMPPQSFGSPLAVGNAMGMISSPLVGQAGVVVVAVQLLGNVPAECHLQGAVAEEGDLFAAVDGSVKVDAVGVVQSLDGLDVLSGVCGVLGVGMRR